VSILDASSGAAGAASLTDMQLAWREWFEQRQRGQEYVQKTNSEPRVDARTEWEAAAADEDDQQDDTETELQPSEPPAERYEERSVQEEYEEGGEEPVRPIPIHRMSSSEAARELMEAAEEPEARIIRERVIPARRTAQAAPSRAGGGISLIGALLLTIIGLAALAIGFLSSGVLDNFLETRGLGNPIPAFISGEMVIE
jgi:hypothetical protein